MRRRRFIELLIGLGVLAVTATGLALVMATPVKAQCGSQASSCKSCHETQATMPVNNDGTGWHQSHAFGDFCYICHGGNNQATDETAAHIGMVAPLADTKASCGQCHPNDLQARSDVYAVKLAAPVAAASSGPSAPTPTSAAATVAPATGPQPAALAPLGAAPNSASLTDYVARYNQNVLDHRPTNWGNIILASLVVILVLGGAIFVNRRERWVTISFTERKQLDHDLPVDVAAIADQLVQLSSTSRKSLSRLLQKPAATAELLAALDRLSTDDSSGDKH